MKSNNPKSASKSLQMFSRGKSAAPGHHRTSWSLSACLALFLSDPCSCHFLWNYSYRDLWVITRLASGNLSQRVSASRLVLTLSNGILSHSFSPNWLVPTARPPSRSRPGNRKGCFCAQQQTPNRSEWSSAHLILEARGPKTPMMAGTISVVPTLYRRTHITPGALKSAQFLFNITQIVLKSLCPSFWYFLRDTG